MSLSYHLTGDGVSISFPNGPARYSEAISSDDSRYGQIVDLLKKTLHASEEEKREIYEEIKNVVTRKALREGKGSVILQNGQFFVDGVPLPSSLNARVLDFEREQIPYDYLLKFFRKLQANPNPRSKEMLYKFLQHNGHPITEEGNFIAYRSVDKNFKDFHTGKFDNSVGAVCSMSRDEVDPDPNNTCSKGLHVATRDYATSFGCGGHIVEVEVDPVDVVAVPNDYHGTKMRVCKFKVVGLSENLRSEALVSTGNGTVASCSTYSRPDLSDVRDECLRDDLDDLDDDYPLSSEDYDYYDDVTYPFSRVYKQATPPRFANLYVPERFRRKLDGGFVEYVEYRNGKVTVSLRSSYKRYRYHGVDPEVVRELYGLITEGSSEVFSFLSTEIMNANYYYEQV